MQPNEGDLIMKRFVSLVTIAFFIFLIVFTTNAAGVPSTTARLKIKSYAYPSYVANVYTSGNPASGNTITLYTPSGSNCQSWRNTIATSSPSTMYRIACYYSSYQNLVMNYNQNTTLCTLYNYLSDPLDDYAVMYYYGDYDTVIALPGHSRVLGASGPGNGASLYWYNRNATVYDNWVITAW